MKQGLLSVVFSCTFLGLIAEPNAATIFVTYQSYKIAGQNTGGCSLQEAIYSSIVHDTYDGVHGLAIVQTDPDVFVTTDCVMGTGNDVIVLPTNGTLNLNAFLDGDAYNAFGPTATPIIISNITIQGNGATLQWTGSGNARLFAVGAPSFPITTPNGTASGTGSLTLSNVYVKGFRVKGGDGGASGGGGGGMGAGGAIYIQGGTLTVDNSTFDGNQAVGGKGASALDAFQGAGGGGMGGKGGDDGGGGGGSKGDGAPGVGGGGGGTVFSGGLASNGIGGSGGLYCGGNGGDSTNNGQDAKCHGGGGGGASNSDSTEAGGRGAYGGGGGGGGSGGDGGFGGGGGSGITGGNGGFGGGGGIGGYPGKPGSFGGVPFVCSPCSYGNAPIGGGGAGLGGAIFNDSGGVTIRNSTFTRNAVAAPGFGGGTAGSAIFSRDGSLTITNSTISGNNPGAFNSNSIVVFGDSPTNPASFTLNDTIIDENAHPCSVQGPFMDAADFVSDVAFTISGTGNLITNNALPVYGQGGPAQLYACPGVVTSVDPQLGLLQLNFPGNTPTMAISFGSSAMNAADPGTSLATDQRGVPRPQATANGFDIGAYEICRRGFGASVQPIVCPPLLAPPGTQFETLMMQASPAETGTTTPAAGSYAESLDSVIPISAVATYGYKFSTWSANVTDPNSPLTTVVMDNDKTVTAYFAYCGCALDVSNSIKVVRGGFALNLTTGRYVQTVTLTNISTTTITGPISLVLDNLSAYASLYNASGSTDSVEPPAGSPYTYATYNSLAPGGSVSTQLQFTDPSRTTPINYATRVLAGPGAR